MASPPSSDPATRVVGAAGEGLATLRRLAGNLRLPRPRRRRSVARRIVLAVLAALATLVVLLVLDGVWAGRAMFRGVAGARSALSEGTVAVVTGDPRASVPHFEDAADDADGALAAAGHPSISLAVRIPWVGDNLRAVEAVAEAERRTADAGLAMARAAEILGWHDLRIPAAEAVGEVDLDTIVEATPAIDEVATVLGAALAELETADTGRLLGPVAAGYDDAVETLRRRAKIALDTRDIMELLPRFLGGARPRRYLLAVQTLGRPQGVGGEVDLIGVLRARDGFLRLESPLSPAADVFTDATATTDARSASENLLAAARESGLGQLDGVLLGDSLWLADLLWTTGTAEVPDRRLPVNSDQAPEVLEEEAFEGLDIAAAATRRAEVATAIVESHLARRPSTEAFAIALARDVAQRHVVIVSTRPREQRVFDRLGAGGASGPPVRQQLDVRWNTAVENHAAVFTRREISHRVTLTNEGTAKVRTVVTLVNEAPTEPPSALLGFPIPATEPDPAGVDPVGGWAADVEVLVPPGAERATAETSIPSDTEIVEEEGRTVAIGRLAADPGDSMSLIVAYRSKAARLADGSYRLVIAPQPAWPAGVVRLRIDAPPGTVITEASPELDVGGVSAQFAGAPTEPFTVWIRFE